MPCIPFSGSGATGAPPLPDGHFSGQPGRSPLLPVLISRFGRIFVLLVTILTVTASLFVGLAMGRQFSKEQTPRKGQISLQKLQVQNFELPKSDIF
jgi:hypothetical protein